MKKIILIFGAALMLCACANKKEKAVSAVAVPKQEIRKAR